jgi:SAM-dependent methyltransferase
MLVLGHIVLATLLRCPGILATKPISITFGDWNNASNAKTKRCGLRLAANSMQSVNWSITCCARSDWAAGILSSMSVAAAGDWRQLASDTSIRYVGTDVVPRLPEAASTAAGRNDWEFRLVEGIRIPCPDNVADFVTFFSVLTHITHEESFQYLQEAARCLKAGGREVLSFLEFRIPCHWETFKISLRAEPGGPLTQFVDRDGLTAWASHSGLMVESFFDGDNGHFPIPEEIKWEDGTVMKSLRNLGQSVAVLRKV